MRRAVSVAVVLLVSGAVLLAAAGLLAACSSAPAGRAGSSGSSLSEVPPDLVPPAAARASVTVTMGGVDRAVPADAVARAVPLLVRRVFDAVEPLANYGLDVPRARIVFTLASGERITLLVGGQDFDKTAYYVQRVGDPRVWLVLSESIAPLLNAA